MPEPLYLFLWTVSIRSLAFSQDQSVSNPSMCSQFYADSTMILPGLPCREPFQHSLTIVEPDHLLYGSDFPFTPGPLVEFVATMLSTTSILDEEQQRAMQRGNALRLFPRL